MKVTLPISKSIANRILLLQAIHGDPLMRVSSDMPDDVLVLHDALEKLRVHKKGEPLTLYLKNCGTALRFLQIHLDQCYPGEPILLDGDPRLKERNGAPTSQTNSALLMHGIEVSDDSPYVAMTRSVIASYPNVDLEPDWSAASYWYEYVAIHGGELLLEGLPDKSVQGDRVVADIFAAHFGVETEFVPQGAKIVNISNRQSIVNCQSSNRQLNLDFTDFPDLYPAIALTCERLGMVLIASGTERLRFKESDRLEAVRLHEVRNDHRMAMAMMCADYEVIEKDQACIQKSYPNFIEQLRKITIHPTPYTLHPFSISHITPIRNINDEGKGKKYALSKLIHAASSEYLWLHDGDVIWPEAATILNRRSFNRQLDLIILPLKMESERTHPSLLERLQIAEYDAIQELTMRTAKAGRAVMCSGANLIVRREAWLDYEPDIHPDIPSGDDMFLLEAMKKRAYQVGVLDEPCYTAVVRPLTSWRAFFRQRMRWAGKAPHYTDPDIRRCGALILTANILQLLFPPILLIKFPIEYRLIRKRQCKNEKMGKCENILIILLLECLYPFYILLSLIGGLFRHKAW